MGKKNFFSNIFYKILELFGDIIKYILTKMSPIHPTRKNDKFTNCWFGLNSNISLMTKVLVEMDIIKYYPKHNLRNLLKNAFYYLISMNSNTIFLMK
jgi:hypothetical protein